MLSRLPHGVTALNCSGVAHVLDNVITALLSFSTSTLTSLHLAGCTLLSQTALAQVAQFTNLTRLSLTKIDAVTDELLATVITGCPRLEALLLIGCSGVSDAMWSALAMAKKLRELDVGYCFNLTDAGVSQFLDNGGGERLEMLGVRLCSKITIDSFAKLAAKCPHLRSVYLGGVADQDGTTRIDLALRQVRPYCKVAL